MIFGTALGLYDVHRVASSRIRQELRIDGVAAIRNREHINWGLVGALRLTTDFKNVRISRQSTACAGLLLCEFFRGLDSHCFILLVEFAGLVDPICLLDICSNDFIRASRPSLRRLRFGTLFSCSTFPLTMLVLFEFHLLIGVFFTIAVFSF